MTQTTEQNTHSQRSPFTTSPFVEVTTDINASIEQVWNAWKDTDLIKQWWGPANFTCPFAENDFRIDGKYLYAMKSKEGEEMWGTGVFKEIFPFELIVCTDQFSDENGDVISAEQAGMSEEWHGLDTFIFSVKFTKTSENSTTIQLVHEGIPASMHDECVDGWSTSLDKLKALLEKKNAH